MDVAEVPIFRLGRSPRSPLGGRRQPLQPDRRLSVRLSLPATPISAPAPRRFPDVEQPVYPATGDPAFNLTSGPAGATAATLAALGRPILHHLDPAFGALYQRTVDLLRQAFGTRESPVILQGEAVVGLEAAAASLIGPGDVVLNLVSGMYGRGYGEWARRYSFHVSRNSASLPRRNCCNATGQTASSNSRCFLCASKPRLRHFASCSSSRSDRSR